MCRQRIPDNLYRKILRSVPMATADVIIKVNGDFLVHKRKNQPVKGDGGFPVAGF
jgi:hypothetical protein